MAFPRNAARCARRRGALSLFLRRLEWSGRPRARRRYEPRERSRAEGLPRLAERRRRVRTQAPARPAARALGGRCAPNDRLAKVEWLGRGSLRGAEAVAVDARGRVHGGTLDGRIVRFDPTTGAFETVASTGGRPLGLAFDRAGNLFICDARRGLLSLAPSGEISVLATEQGGIPFRLPDDVDVGSDGTVYLTHASSRFDIAQIREDVLQHAGNGRLLTWRPATRKVELLLRGLQFANCVALAGDDSYVLVN